MYNLFLLSQTFKTITCGVVIADNGRLFIFTNLMKHSYFWSVVAFKWKFYLQGILTTNSLLSAGVEARGTSLLNWEDYHQDGFFTLTSR